MLPAAVTGHRRRSWPTCWSRATSSSTAATPTTATTSTGPSSSSRRTCTTLTSALSGGVFGLERGYCLMIGGEDEPVEHLDPLFKTIAPGAGTAEPTPGRTRTGTAQDGYLHCGPNGAGHFVKMVHNGIEYGMMAAIAEGLNIIKHANVGKSRDQCGRGDHPAARPAVLPVQHRRRRGRRGVAARLGDQLVADRPDRRRAGPLARTWTTSPGACPTRARAAGR